MKALALIVVFLLLTGCANAEETQPASSNDVCEILQLVVDLPKLQQYYHVGDAPSRSPLRLVTNNTTAICTSLTKFGKKVVAHDVNAKYKQSFPYLEVAEIEIKSNEVTIRFEYKVEGLKGSASFRKKTGKWTLYQSHVFEI